jgi:hypothetical protein
VAVVTTVSILFVILAAICLRLVGLLTYARRLSWFGRLPGDIRHRGVHTRIYVPVTSTLLLSVLLEESLLGYNLPASSPIILLESSS